MSFLHYVQDTYDAARARTETHHEAMGPTTKALMREGANDSRARKRGTAGRARRGSSATHHGQVRVHGHRLTALQRVDDALKIQRGESLVRRRPNGNVGMIVVQFAKWRGREFSPQLKTEYIAVASRQFAADGIDLTV